MVLIGGGAEGRSGGAALPEGVSGGTGWRLDL